MTERRKGGVLAGRRMSRRDFLKVGGTGLAGAALLGVAGCGGGEEPTGGMTSLVFSFGPDPSGNLQDTIGRFNDEYKGEIQVEYREMPSDTGQYFNQLRTELQAGASPIDVIGGDVVWPAQLAANGWIMDLSDRFTEEMRNRFVDAAIRSVTYSDSIWGVPFFTDAGLLYYRTDLLEEAGYSDPPLTWGELKEMALDTSQKTGTKYGFVFQGAEYEGGVVDGLEYIWTHGGDALEEEQQDVTIDSPEAVAGLETERSMITDGVAPVAVSIYKEPESHAIFLAGDAVFCRNWPYMYGLVEDPAQSSIKLDQVGIAAVPHAEGDQSFSGLGGWNMMINANSQKQDQAWEFVRFMTGEEGQRQRAISATLLPTLKSLYDDQEILDQVPVIRLGKDAIQSTKSRPVSPYYSDMSLKMAEQFSLSLKGDVAPEEAVKTLQTELTSIIEQGG